MAGVNIHVSQFAVNCEHILKHLQEQEMEFTRLNNIVGFIEEVWESESQREFSAKFQEQKEDIQNSLEALRSDITDMQKYVRDWMAYDGWLAEKLRVPE